MKTQDLKNPYIKNWEVIGITMQGKKFKQTIVLGRLSDKFDVMQFFRRHIGNIREVTSIREIA